MERQFFSGNSVEQAVLAAARHYELDPDRIAYKVRDKKHGFVNVRRRVVIEVDPEAPERAVTAARSTEKTATEKTATEKTREEGRRPVAAEESRARVRPAPRTSDDSDEDQPEIFWRGSAPSWAVDDEQNRDLAAIETALEEIVSLLGLQLEISIRRGEEAFEAELSGEDGSALLAREGALLDAIEHLLPRMVRGLVGDAVPCRLDSGGFRAAHRRELRSAAERAAAEVRQEQQSRLLEPMNPADRRLVHMALAEDPSVRTESEGGGFLKRVRITPA